jgi:hypothetical protein
MEKTKNYVNIKSLKNKKEKKMDYGLASSTLKFWLNSAN